MIRAACRPTSSRPSRGSRRRRLPSRRAEIGSSGGGARSLHEAVVEVEVPAVVVESFQSGPRPRAVKRTMTTTRPRPARRASGQRRRFTEAGRRAGVRAAPGPASSVLGVPALACGLMLSANAPTRRGRLGGRRRYRGGGVHGRRAREGQGAAGRRAALMEALPRRRRRGFKTRAAAAAPADLSGDAPKRVGSNSSPGGARSRDGPRTTTTRPRRPRRVAAPPPPPPTTTPRKSVEPAGFAPSKAAKPVAPPDASRCKRPCHRALERKRAIVLLKHPTNVTV